MASRISEYARHHDDGRTGQDAPGPIEWQLVSDGSMAYPRAVVLANAAPAALDAAGVAAEVVTPYNALVVRAAGRLILVDAGIGERGGDMGDTAGHLASNLGRDNLADVDDVVVTHAHADHVGGLLTGERLTFPAARHHLARAEWAFWMDGDPRARMYAPLADALLDTARK